MRVISRRANEGLVVGENIFITVLDIHEDRVRLSISSPNAVPSYREETLYWQPEEQEDDFLPWQLPEDSHVMQMG